MLHVTDLLEIVGLILVAVAAFMVAGAAAAVAVTGGACLWVSWGLSKR